MRITLTLEDDAVKAVKSHAKLLRLSLGEAASELIRRGVRYQLGIRRVNGLPVLDAPQDFPTITSKQIRELLGEE